MERFETINDFKEFRNMKKSGYKLAMDSAKRMRKMTVLVSLWLNLEIIFGFIPRQ